MPTDQAERIVTGAKALSPYLGERMVATRVARKPVVILELRPQDLKFELIKLKTEEAIAVARLMAGIVGRAHSRQMRRKDRQAWVRELRGRHSKGLDALR